MLVVSLTVDALLKKTVVSLFYQTIQPDVIQVFISEHDASIEAELQLLNIYRIPLYFKLKPSIQTYKNADVLVLDNIEYETTFIEMFLKHSESNTLKDRIPLGTDIKILQYETYARDRCSTSIDLIQLLNQVDTNCILINMEKDTLRYSSAVEEFKKISLKTFVHLKATYWKDKDKLLGDLRYILDFLRIDSEVTVNSFSEISDSNIVIQDGPLACYCAHMRALIYGYLHFKEYMICAEDDIHISNTKKIEEYIQMIPDDWDIICLNAAAINERYTEPFYKFRNTFHSTHFYIIKIKCLPFLFKNMYPIIDQIDILISNLYNKLNIYNIVNTVYQKNFSTNTQNNLYVLFNSPNYQPIRDYIKEFEDELLDYINITFPDNHENNCNIKDSIMFDVVYSYIINHEVTETNKICNLVNNTILYNKLYIFLNCCVKGINLDETVSMLLNSIHTILDCFTLHEKVYSYGSTANVYKCGDTIKKVYNTKLRWVCKDHDDSKKIFNKEVFILKKLDRIITLDEMSFTMRYLGESLYTHFNLPMDWKEQVTSIFEEFTTCGIEYPEFNIKNIVVLDGTLSFIDFGLARISETADNVDNCKLTIELLDKLNQHTFKKEVYATFINNLKISGHLP